MSLVQAPLRSPEQDELEALIEEARRRARRRRFGYVALAMVAGAVAATLYLALGGGGGGGASRGLTSTGPGLGAAPGSGPSSAATAYRCPTSTAALKARAGAGIPGCEIRFWAALPAGWDQGPARVTAFPPGAILSQPLGFYVRYANVPLSGPGPRWPIRLPPNGLAILIETDSPASKAESAQADPIDIRSSDFRRVPVEHNERLAHTSLYTGGWHFQVEVRVGANGPQRESLGQANALLNSIETTQHLCPCGSQSRRG